MRVIGGQSRGRRLVAPVPKGVRPTSDRVREAIFDILFSLGGVVGATVVDLCCGSGALGVEALSRGAASATFVDSDPGSLLAVRANLDAVGLAHQRATLVRADVPGWLDRAPHFDLALCDPPYSFDRWDDLLVRLDAATAVLESAQALVIPERWIVARARRYGGTLVTVVQSTSSEPAEPGVGAP